MSLDQANSPAATDRTDPRRYAPEVVACAFAIAWYVHLGYGKTLDPRRIEWMLRGDWSTYLWGFLFHRNAEWSFPLGATPGFVYPHGTSIAFTDANPWVSTFFRALSPLLPLDFQFAGLWFLACYVLQALFGARVVAIYTGDPVRRALGGMLFALTPVLPARHAHVTLCSLFLLTGALSLGLAPTLSRRDAARRYLLALALVVWSSGTHAYLSVMVLALVLAFCARLAFVDRCLRPLEALAAIGGAVGAALLTYLLFGYIGDRTVVMGEEGFGDFSSDLTALWNPMGWSRFVEGLPARPRQHEGFAYLGLGVLALLALRVVLWISRPRTALAGALRLAPLLLVLAILFVYSWSSRITYLGDEVASLEPLYARLGELPSMFRASGRFAWPLHLGLVAAACSAGAAIAWAWPARALMLAAVLLQAVELDPGRLDFEPRPMERLVDPAWASLSGDYRHLALHPLHLLWVCRYDERLVNRLSYEAYRRRLTFNSGNLARKPPGIQRECERHLRPDEFDEETVYVVRGGAFVADFRAVEASCGVVDGLVVCVSSRQRTPMLAAVERRPVM